MMRRVALAAGVLLLAAAAYFWWAFVGTFQQVDGSTVEPPGSVTLHLHPGSYRVYVRNQIANGDQCSPSDHFSDVAAMGITLTRASDGTVLHPEQATLCDGGSSDTGVKPLSVSQIRVHDEDDYELRARHQLGLTAYGKPAEVYLTDASWQVADFVIALAGTIVGFGLVVTSLRRRRPA